MGKLMQFSTKEKDLIKEAVRDLENSTSGELRPVFIRRSDEYAESNWYGAFIGAVLAITSLLLISYQWMIPQGTSIMVLLIVVLIMMAIGFAIPVIFPRVAVMLVGQQKVQVRILQRATEVFLHEEIFNTRKRNGILLMVSELERKVVILSDSGINQLVQQEEWEEIVEVVLKKIRKRQFAEGIVQAIQMCRDLLLKNGFRAQKDDLNELPDDIRTID
jgi:uncharacterized membrane protein